MDLRRSNVTFGGIRINVNIQKKYGNRFYKFLTIFSVCAASLVFLYKLIELDESK